MTRPWFPSRAIFYPGVLVNLESDLSEFEILKRESLFELIRNETAKKFTWADIITTRSIASRGSAIKGQKREEHLENLVEKMIQDALPDIPYKRSKQKTNDERKGADFLIPDINPKILIEVKAYGSTGSKLSDIKGDIEKINSTMTKNQKLMLVTDGWGWLGRRSDLSQLLEIYRDKLSILYDVYLIKMKDKFLSDVRSQY